ncbi:MULTISPECIES: hypothetical protein [Marinobacter]|uniref:hypothetical protein n=1 Tax=Marinobacter TaxID=2742 RepID=UPI0012471F8B|nr:MULTISPECIES: hypothetical protein [Marinobacter]MBL3556407.1 hypothetical protein [Marinobacter sp. JB05H06]
MKKLQGILNGKAAVKIAWLRWVKISSLVFLGLLGVFLTAAPEEQNSLAVFGVIYPVLYDCLGRRSLAAVVVSLVTCQLFPEIAQSFDAIGRLV